MPSWIVLACPMCADLVEKGRAALEGWRFGQAVNASVVFMLIVPLGIFLSMGFWIGRLKKERPANDKVRLS